MREIASATIAAQLAVLPLLLYQNGLFSAIALPANLLVLPVVPAAMAASAFAGVIGALLPALAPVAGLPAYALLSYITGLVRVLDALPLASFSVPAFPFWLVPLSYAGLGYLAWRYRVAPKRYAARPSIPQSV
jgi:competence protein ComEC